MSRAFPIPVHRLNHLVTANVSTFDNFARRELQLERGVASESIGSARLEAPG